MPGLPVVVKASQICSWIPALRAAQLRPTEQKGRELNAPSIEALARPNGKTRKAAPGWARALGGLPFEIRKVSIETVAEATRNGFCSVYMIFLTARW